MPLIDEWLQRKRTILTTPKRNKVLYGGRGSGKSWLIAECLLLIALNAKVRILCTREIQNSIRDSVWRLLRDTIDRLGWLEHFEVTNDSIRCTRSGSEFIFKGLRLNPSIKSTEGIDIAWVEEAQLVSDESWAILIPTVRKKGSEIWISYNPDVADTPVHRRFIATPRDDVLAFKINWNDNPFFPDVLKAEKDYLYRVDPEAAANIWGGELRTNSALSIFSGKYVIEPIPEGLHKEAERLFFGADFGFANDPSTLVRCFIIDRTLFIDAEWYGIGVDIDLLPEAYRTIPESDRWTIYADCARPETISYLKRHGFPRCEPSPKWQGSIEDGIAFIRGFEKVVIGTNCPHTADEFRLYSWKADRLTGKALPVPEDKQNHIVDALRYALSEFIQDNGIGAFLKMGRD